MDRALANALKKRAILEQEIAEIDRFIELHTKFLNETVGEQAELASKAPSVAEGRAGGYSGSSESLAKRASPPEIANAAERVIRDVGRPLTRSELVRELEARDFIIPSEDKVNYVGTILWRHAKDRLVNLGGKGYWISDVPNLEIGYDPTTFLTEADKHSAIQSVLEPLSKDDFQHILRDYKLNQTIPRDFDRILLRHCADALGRPLKEDELREMRRLLAEAASSTLQRDKLFD